MKIEKWNARWLAAGALAFALLTSHLALSALAADGPLVRVNHLGDTVAAPYVTNVSTTVITLFSTNKSELNGRVLVRTVQNNGTTPVLYAINFTNVSATAYHGIIAPGVASRDGLGSVLDLSAIRYPVSFRTESGSSEISIVEIRQ